MSDLPAPPVPPDCDLRDFSFFPLDAARLRDSELAASPDAEVFRVAVLSWCYAWHQIPAGSLPSDEGTQARALGFGRDLKRWRKVLSAGGLRGWYPANDGRLYHPVVAEKVSEAWRRKMVQRWNTEIARIKKHNQRHGTDVQFPTFEGWTKAGCPQGQPLAVPGDKPGKSQGLADPRDSGQGQWTGTGTGRKKDESNDSNAGASASSPEPDFLTDDPTGQPARIITPGGSLGDLEAMHPALLVPREERAKASTVLALYGWDLCAQALTAIAAEAGPAPMGRRRRIFPDHLSAWLSARFDLGPEDYARAGITPPPKA